jgi:hypothetical protein
MQRSRHKHAILSFALVWSPSSCLVRKYPNLSDWLGSVKVPGRSKRYWTLNLLSERSLQRQWPVWHCMSVAPWHCMSAAPWHCMSVAPWHCMSVAPWHCMSVAQWHCMSVAPWHCMSVAPWHCMSVAPWHCMSVAPCRSLCVSKNLVESVMKRICDSDWVTERLTAWVEWAWT